MIKENEKKTEQDFEEVSEELNTECEETAEETPEAPDIAAIVEAMKKEYEDLNDKYMRLYADFDNYKKRSVKERSDALNYASVPLMEKLLGVMDNFDRALASCEDQESAFCEGVKMVSRQLTDILTAEGLKVIETQDCQFDPNLHNAVMVDNDADKEDNVITAEFQKGYMFKDKVVRPSMVKVNKLN